MAIISILTDNHGNYRGTEVTPSFMEKGWDKRVFESPRKNIYIRVIADFMSAITFLDKKDLFAIMFSSSIEEFVKNHQYKLTFFKFSYMHDHKFERNQIVIAPAHVKDQYDFCQYLSDNEIYDVPEGYRSCWFIAFYEVAGQMFKNELKRRYPVINGSVVVIINEKRHGFLLHFAKISEYTGFLNCNDNIVTSCFSKNEEDVIDDLFLCVKSNYIDFDEAMKYEFNSFIDSYVKKRTEELASRLESSKKEIKCIELGV